MDSTNVVTELANQDIQMIITLINGAVMGVLIMPLVEILKKITFFHNVKAQDMALLLTIIFVGILQFFIAPGMTLLQIINAGFAAFGAATAMHRGKKVIL